MFTKVIIFSSEPWKDIVLKVFKALIMTSIAFNVTLKNVFEVEQQIRIRPQQYKVAKHLIDHPGDIVQLNMGLGKTRVIILMLIMHWALSEERKGIPRVHILNSLFKEACDFFHETLCASILDLKMYLLPFCRDVELNTSNLKCICEMLSQCRCLKGFLVLAPHHKSSLELKYQEILENLAFVQNGQLVQILLFQLSRPLDWTIRFFGPKTF